MGTGARFHGWTTSAGQQCCGVAGHSRSAFCALLLGMTVAVTLPVRAEPAQLSQDVRAVQDYDIPAGSLASALNRLANQSGLVIVYGAELTSGLSTPGLQGSYTPDQVLQQLLAGTGLNRRYSDANTVTLVRAAAPQDSGPIRLEPLVVRGELLDRTAFESPTSAVVITGEDLERSGDTDLYDVIERTPGITSTFGDTGFAIRGISQDSVGGSGNGLTISTQIDGVALPTSQATWNAPFSTWDLGQVEVLRGPQSTQQGRNALAGAVVIRTADPTFTQEVRVRGEYASRDTRRFAVVANTPLIEDILAVRVAAETVRGDGFIENSFTGTDANEDDDTNYRAKLLFAPTNNFEAVLSYSFYDVNVGAERIVGSDYPDALEIESEISDFGDAEHEVAGLRASWDIGDSFTLESETSYYSLERLGVFDADFSAAALVVSEGNLEADVFEQDLSLTFDLGATSGIVGLFYTDIDNTSRSDASSPVFDQVLERDFDIRNAAAFGEIELDANRLAEGLSFTVGARYDYEDFTFETERVRTDAIGNVTATSGASDTTFSAVLPKAGVRYELTPDHAIAFTIQRGYRSGGAGEDNGSSFEFDPEYTTNLELAYRGVLLEDRLNVSANVFYTDWRNQQVSRDRVSDVGLPFSDVVNAGESRLFGGELSLEAGLTEKLDVFGALAYSNTEYTDFVAFGEDFTGNDFPFAPEWQASLGASYAWDFGLTASVNANYQSRAFADPANTLEVDERVLVNANLAYEQDGWLLGLYGRNLFDEEYVTSVQAAGFGVGSTVEVGEPRTIGVYLQKTF